MTGSAGTSVETRREVPDDRARIFQVEAAAFSSPNEAALVDALREAAHPHLSLVALLEGEIVGHVFFSPVTMEARPEVRVAALGPIGVDPAHQGRGIGSALVRAGLEQCPGQGWGAVFLVGNPVYYSRFGFVMAPPLGFTYENPALAPALQVVELVAGTLEGAAGPARFHPAFAEAE